jgi:hypothetical protein
VTTGKAPLSFKPQFGLRIGLGVASEQDARMIIPDDATVATTLARLQHPGSGIVSYRNTRPAPVKFYRIEHDQKAHLAQACGIKGSSQPGTCSYRTPDRSRPVSMTSTMRSRSSL